MSLNFADRLLRAIAEKGSPVCVGVDPVYARLPQELQPASADADAQVQAIGEYCRQLLEVVAPYTPAVKPQSAYFEAYGAPGVAVYHQVVAQARRLGLIVIGDVKRNDIGSTAEAYAKGHLDLPDSADSVTVNGYLGSDGIGPFVDVAARTGRGVFVLVRTSNPSARELQDLCDAAGRKLFERMAELVAQLGAASVGQAGYSCLGAVVGATYPEEARLLRTLMPEQIFLVPGYGAQGATAQDCAASFKPDGSGAIVNASRSVIFAYREPQYVGQDWKQAIESAAKAFAQDIREATQS